MVIPELVDDLEKSLKRFRIAVGKIGILEDVAEECRDAGVFRHLGDAFGVETKHFVAAQRWGHELSPAVASKVAREEFPLAAEFLGLGVHVIHEFVNKSDGDL